MGHGVTTPSTLAPYQASNTVGPKPSDPKTFAYAQDSPRGFEQLLASGIRAGAKAEGIKFESAESNADPQTQVQNMQQFLAQGVGAMATSPDAGAKALEPVMLQAISKGVYMDGLLFGPAITQVDAPMYDEGHVLAEHAAQFIKSSLGGKAEVVLLNQNTQSPATRPRFTAMEKVFGQMPGVKIVANVEPAETDPEHGFQTMTTVLQKYPHANVVLGADAVVEGAYASMQAAGKLSSKDFLGGIDCEQAAVADILKHSGYKACVSTEPAVFGYAWGRFAGRWLNGLNVPQGIEILPFSVTNAAQAKSYLADQSDPERVWNDPSKLKSYLSFYGSISYGTRDKFLNYAWVGPGHNG